MFYCVAFLNVSPFPNGTCFRMIARTGEGPAGCSTVRFTCGSYIPVHGYELLAGLD